VARPVTVARAGWLLAALTFVRLAVCAAMPVTPDEAYYWTWSRALAPGYLDHPPMVAVWIHATTAVFGDTPLGIRASGPLAVALGSMLLAGAGRDLFPGIGAQVGARAALLLNATLALGVGCVVMTPDTPLVLFCCVAVWGLGRVIATGRGAWWLVVGGSFGAAFDSKYTAVLPAAGLVLWLVLWPEGRRWLRSPWLWGAGALGLAACAPVVVWNLHHHWASFLRQGGRVGSWQAGRAAQFLGELLGGQAGLATPLVFALMLVAFVRLLRPRCLRGTDALLACMLAVPGVVFTLHALGDRVQANWPVLLYPVAALPAARLTVAGGVRWAARLYPAAVISGFALTALVYGQAVWSVLPLSPHHDIMLRQTGGWSALARDVRSHQAPGESVLAEDYGLAAELALNGVPGVVAGPDPRWAFFRMSHDVPATALIVRSMRHREPLETGLFASVKPAGAVLRTHAGKEIEGYRLFHVVLKSGLTPQVTAMAGMPSPVK